MLYMANKLIFSYVITRIREYKLIKYRKFYLIVLINALIFSLLTFNMTAKQD